LILLLLNNGLGGSLELDIELLLLLTDNEDDIIYLFINFCIFKLFTYLFINIQILLLTILFYYIYHLY